MSKMSKNTAGNISWWIRITPYIFKLDLSKIVVGEFSSIIKSLNNFVKFFFTLLHEKLYNFVTKILQSESGVLLGRVRYQAVSFFFYSLHNMCHNGFKRGVSREVVRGINTAARRPWRLPSWFSRAGGYTPRPLLLKKFEVLPHFP